MDRQTNAFTIIELIVVVAIIALITGMSLAYYYDQNTTNKLKAESQKLIDVFDLTRKRAMSSEKPDGCTLIDYTISFISNSKYSVIRDTADCVDPTRQQDYILTDTIINNWPINAIIFKPISGSISPDTTTIKFKISSSCYGVTFTSSGASDPVPVACT